MREFFGCYLLASQSPKHKGRTYIGFTVNPRRRIRQHNGLIKNGAWKTHKGRPWEMTLVLYGFPTKIQALQFEWAWQHPERSLIVRPIAQALGRQRMQGVRGKILLMLSMLHESPWRHFPLTLQYLAPHRHMLYCATCASPFHLDCMAARWAATAVPAAADAAVAWSAGGGGGGSRFGGVPEQGSCPACGAAHTWMELLRGMQTVGWGNKSGRRQSIALSSSASPSPSTSPAASRSPSPAPLLARGRGGSSTGPAAGAAARARRVGGGGGGNGAAAAAAEGTGWGHMQRLLAESDRDEEEAGAAGDFGGGGASGGPAAPDDDDEMSDDVIIID
eukprot:XP_001692487.1 predicted protein [Chlamydomonas reinhardtii]